MTLVCRIEKAEPLSAQKNSLNRLRPRYIKRKARVKRGLFSFEAVIRRTVYFVTLTKLADQPPMVRVDEIAVFGVAAEVWRTFTPCPALIEPVVLV